MELKPRPQLPKREDKQYEEAFDKYKDYKVDFHGNEPCDIEDKACADRHRDKVLEELCDSHPSAPMCRVYDD